MDNFLNQMQNEFKQVKQDFKVAFNQNDFDNSGGGSSNFNQPQQQQANGGGSLMNMQSDLPQNRNVNFNGRRLLIEKLLGEGGFAFVYQVVDTSTGQRFALKKMMTQNKSQEIVSQIQNEVKIWKQINNHKNIIGIHGVEQQRDCIMILCDLCEGGTLFDLIMKYNGKMQEQQIIHILIDVCSGLQHMHRQGVQHRDIKVENILLDKNNKAFRLCDFGSASTAVLDHRGGASYQQIEDQFEYYEKYTTMMYRPPEMIDRYMKYKVDTQVDVWMLGCVIFSMAFNYHPYQECAKIGILNAQYFMPVNDPEIDSRISQKLKDLIHIILVPNPEDRPTIDQILEILKNWQRIPKIKLTRSAEEIRLKNLGGQEVPKSNGPRKKMGDMTYDDMAKLQQKIKEEQDRKKQKKQHIPLDQNASLRQGGGYSQQPKRTNTQYQQQRQQQRPQPLQQQQRHQQDDLFNFDMSNQPKTFDFNSQQASNQSPQINDFFDFGSGSAQSQKSQQNNGNTFKSQGRGNAMGPNVNSFKQTQMQGEVENSNLLDFNEEAPKKPGTLLEEMSGMSGFYIEDVQQQQNNSQPATSQKSAQQQQPQQDMNAFFNFDMGSAGGGSSSNQNNQQPPAQQAAQSQQQQKEQKIEDFFQF